MTYSRVFTREDKSVENIVLNKFLPEIKYKQYTPYKKAWTKMWKLPWLATTWNKHISLSWSAEMTKTEIKIT